MSTCESCEILSINGVRCHEHGCPDAWRDETRECLFCGQAFQPADQHERTCDAECTAAYYGGEADDYR